MIKVKKAKVKEVSFHFKPRNAGESKIIKNEMLETLRVIFLLQYHNPGIRRFIKFVMVGSIGFVINFVFLRIFRSMGFPEFIVWVLATELAIMSNFTLNNMWTFKESKIGGFAHTLKKFFQFNLTSAGALLIQSIAGPIGVALVGEQYDYLVLAFIVAFMVLPYNYFMYNYFIWGTWRKSERIA